ncbi:MAG: pilus assembly protein PilM [Candidatus Sumerlaeaceae bacterium]|nr:pilus assembly protein PilM [Candidatus Sumerlaeaceae bacterium]
MATFAAIEFTELEARILVGERSRGKLSLRGRTTVPLPRIEEAAERIANRANLLKEAFKTLKAKPQAVRIVIPKNFVMVRTVTLPSEAEEELAGMARFEAERHIPFNAERHIVSHCIVQKTGVQGSQVLLAAVDGPVATEYLEICLKAGLAVENFTVSSLATFNALNAAQPEAVKERTVAIINIGYGSTDFSIATNGVLTFTRAASVGPAKFDGAVDGSTGPARKWSVGELAQLDAMEPDRYFARLHSTVEAGEPGLAAPAPFSLDSNIFPALSAPPETSAEAESPEYKANLGLRNGLLLLIKEMKRTHEFARREFNFPAVDQIYICGEGALVRNLPEYLRLNLGVPCTVFDPLASLGGTGDSSGGPATLFASCSGALLGDAQQQVRVNLLPSDYIEKQKKQRSQQSWIISGILAVGMLALGYIYLYDLFTHQEKMLEEYTQLNKKMKSKVVDLQAKESRLNIIKQNTQDKHSALDVIERISEFTFIPDSVTLTRFEYQKDQYVKISGHAKAIADVNRMRSELEKTGYFQAVTIDEGSNRQMTLPARSEPVLEYSITATFPKRETKKSGTAPAKDKV